MSEKKYRLKKDLPDAKAGTILDWNEFNNRYNYTDINGITGWYDKESVEDNLEWFEIIPDPKEWEILIVQNDKVGKVLFSGFYKNTTEEILKSFSINSVKRLSDGEVFSIGDYFTTDKSSGNYKIVGFLIKKGGMMVDTGGCGCVFLNYLNKKSVLAKEETKEQSFKWTDELVMEFWGTVYNTPVADKHKCIIDFIKSKKPAPSSKERIEVTKLSNSGFSDHGNYYKFHIADRPGKPWAVISDEKMPLIKEAIERCLNDERVYTESEVRRIREDTWVAARKMSSLNKDCYSFVSLDHYLNISTH